MKEIKRVVRALDSDSAPEPNGFPLFFFCLFSEKTKKELRDILIEIAPGWTE